MAFFGKSKEGGMLDVIRCDEENYLVWKWRPSGDANSTSKENSIRWGSSLRVKDGEVAVFVYKQSDGPNQDFIEGPYDDTIKTANFPVLTSIIGSAFGGSSPFQAEIYFINLAGNQRRPFGVPKFNVGDPRLPDFFAPVSANGSFTFNITDYRAFIKLHRLINFDPEQFSLGVRDAVVKTVKAIISRAPREAGIPLVLLTQEIDRLSDIVESKLKIEFFEDFGVNLKRFDLSEILIDEKSEAYQQLRHLTAEQSIKMVNAQTDTNVQNLYDMQKINKTNLEDTLLIQRNQADRFAALQTQSQFIGAHQANLNADVLKTAAESLGKMGSMGLDGGGNGGGGINPVGIITGMAVGGAMGGQMAQMMNATGQQIPMPGSMPPPVPQVSFNVLINGQNSGPFVISQLQEMVRLNQLTKDTYVWKPSMSNWELAGNVEELRQIFMTASAPPPPPPPPPQSNPSST